MEPLQSPSSPPKYNNVLIVVIVALVLIILLLLFKSPLPAPPGPPPAPPPPGREQGTELSKTKIQKGIILAYQCNAHYDVNALQLKTDDDGVIVVDFLPHTAQAVMQTAAVGNLVELEIGKRPDDEQVGYQLVSIRNIKSGAEFRGFNLPPPPDVPNHITENFNIENPSVMTDKYGGIVALKKNDLLFHFKPGLVDDIAGLIKSANKFGIQAVKRDDNLGFVNIQHDKVYIVLSLTIDNKTFLVR